MKRSIILMLTTMLMFGFMAPCFATDQPVAYASQVKENDNNNGDMVDNNIGNNMRGVTNTNDDDDTDWGWIGLAGLLGLLGLRRQEERK